MRRCLYLTAAAIVVMALTVNALAAELRTGGRDVNVTHRDVEKI